MEIVETEGGKSRRQSYRVLRRQSMNEQKFVGEMEETEMSIMITKRI